MLQKYPYLGTFSLNYILNVNFGKNYLVHAVISTEASLEVYSGRAK